MTAIVVDLRQLWLELWQGILKIVMMEIFKWRVDEKSEILCESIRTQGGSKVDMAKSKSSRDKLEHRDA